MKLDETGVCSSAMKMGLINTRSGHPSLQVTKSDGSQKSLHSLYDPENEAVRMIDAFEFNGRGVLVVLGLGLGYHISELAARYGDADILVVESEEEIIEKAKRYRPEIFKEVTVMEGMSPQEVIREISKLQIEKGMPPVTVFSLPAAVSLFPEYYITIRESLRKTMSVKLWDRLRYRKFADEKKRVLVLDSQYFLVREAEKTLRLLGHDVAGLPVPCDGDGEGIMKALIGIIIDFKPDCLLTINHLGFDEKGVLASFLESIEMPVAVWYVDSPAFVVRAFEKNVSAYTTLFLWDRSYIAEMRSMGFESIHYLPLATDEKVFKPMNARKHRKKLSRYACDIGFVGNSMVEAVSKYQGKVPEELHALVNSTAERISSQGAPPESVSEYIYERDRGLLENLSAAELMDFEAAVIWQATQDYRLACIRKLKAKSVHIHGDRGWKSLLDSSGIELREPLHYYREAPLLYNAARVNFNATSLQMREAVNQRVFDVPACGAFLMSDYRNALDELFEVGSELIVYEHVDEIPELADFYLRNEEKRRKVAEKGRERLLRDHTYKRRMESLLVSMEKRYK